MEALPCFLNCSIKAASDQKLSQMWPSTPGPAILSVHSNHHDHTGSARVCFLHLSQPSHWLVIQLPKEGLFPPSKVPALLRKSTAGTAWADPRVSGLSKTTEISDTVPPAPTPFSPVRTELILAQARMGWGSHTPPWHSQGQERNSVTFHQFSIQTCYTRQFNGS